VTDKSQVSTEDLLGIADLGIKVAENKAENKSIDPMVLVADAARQAGAKVEDVRCIGCGQNWFTIDAPLPDKCPDCGDPLPRVIGVDALKAKLAEVQVDALKAKLVEAQVADASQVAESLAPGTPAWNEIRDAALEGYVEPVKDAALVEAINAKLAQQGTREAEKTEWYVIRTPQGQYLAPLALVPWHYLGLTGSRGTPGAWPLDYAAAIATCLHKDLTVVALKDAHEAYLCARRKHDVDAIERSANKRRERRVHARLAARSSATRAPVGGRGDGTSGKVKL
jgi:hypothetical protein